MHNPRSWPAQLGRNRRRCVLNKNPYRLATLGLLAAFGLAGTASAEPGRYPPTYFQAGIGGSIVKTDTIDQHQDAADWMVGYRINQYVGVQAVGFNLNSTVHQRGVPGGPPLYDFDSYWGGQVVGFIPATPYWDIYGELGGGQVHETANVAGAPAHDKGDALTGVGIRWQIIDHFALNLGFSYLWNTKVMHTGLRADVNF
jgi:hypothetical protein